MFGREERMRFNHDGRTNLEGGVRLILNQVHRYFILQEKEFQSQQLLYQLGRYWIRSRMITAIMVIILIQKSFVEGLERECKLQDRD